MNKLRLVIDTNVLISGLLSSNSIHKRFLTMLHLKQHF